MLIHHRFIVEAGAGDAQKLRLATDGNLSIRIVNERYLISMGQDQIFF